MKSKLEGWQYEARIFAVGPHEKGGGSSVLQSRVLVPSPGSQPSVPVAAGWAGFLWDLR